MTLVSYAQNQEDIMLWRALLQVENGFYIDVGAASPESLSVTRLFYEHGWHGINLEPNPAYFELLERDRPRDINLPVGAGAAPGAKVFYIVEGTGLSTFDSEIAAQHEAGNWQVTEQVADIMTLTEICRQHRPHGPIHFLKIDVEGFEGAVLAGADFQTFRPWIILVEATLPMSQQQSFETWEPILTRHGYSFVWFDGLNRFYLADEMQAELAPCFCVQPNVFDAFLKTADVLQRAEQSLAEAMADSARKEREAEAMLRETSEALARQTALTEDAKARCETLCAELSHSRARAEIAESWRQAMAASTSWRITAPLRMAKRMLRRRPVPLHAGNAEPGPVTVKDLARKGFHFGVAFVLSVPGGHRMSRFAYALAPKQVEFLARRYRAYDKRGESAAKTTSRLLPENARIDPASPAPAGLSVAEARIYRQIIAYAVHPGH